MDEKTKQRIGKIRKRLEEYKKHVNNHSVYEIDKVCAMRRLEIHAPEDIEFLLNELNKALKK